MIQGQAGLKFELIEKIVQTDRNVLTVEDMCALAGVSRSGYYRWIRHADERKKQELQDKEDFLIILEAYRFRGFDKGARGIYMRLLHQGIVMNVKKIRRIMKKNHLACPIRQQNPYKQMLREMRTDVVFENLVNREFKGHGARKILLTDITYIRIPGQFVYLSVIIDAYTMQALAYQLSETLRVEFVLKTVQQLIQDHGMTLDTETMIHSDQGSHYTSVSFRELIKDSSLIQSMSRKGNCWDNAPQESFFGHMKDELGERSKHWQTIADVQTDIDDWMDYYNNDRYQVGLKKLSPNEYYEYVCTGIYPLPISESNNRKTSEIIS